MNNQHFFYRKDGQLKKISLEDILFIEAADNYAKFYTSSASAILVRTTLDATMNQLPENMFMRISRKHAVALAYLDIVAREEVIFATKPRFSLPVSKQYYASCMQQVAILEPATSLSKQNRNKNEHAFGDFILITTWEDGFEVHGINDIKKVLKEMATMSDNNEALYIAKNDTENTLQISQHLDVMYVHKNVEDTLITILDSWDEAEELCRYFINSNFDKVKRIIENKNIEMQEE